MNNKENRKKFTTTLSIDTIEKLELIKIYMKRSEPSIRSLNEVIEHIVDKEWRVVKDDKNN